MNSYLCLWGALPDNLVDQMDGVSGNAKEPDPSRVVAEALERRPHDGPPILHDFNFENSRSPGDKLGHEVAVFLLVTLDRDSLIGRDDVTGSWHDDVKLFTASAQGVDDEVGRLGHACVVQALSVGRHLFAIQRIAHFGLHWPGSNGQPRLKERRKRKLKIV